MFKIQKKNNPEVIKNLNQNIAQTTLKNKEIDLALLIDVLEHLENSHKAVKEISRITRYSIFKVPFKNKLLHVLINFLINNKIKNKSRETVSHININNFFSLKSLLKKHCGKIISYQFTNVSDYYKKSKCYRQKSSLKVKLIDQLAIKIFRISPYFSSTLIKDFLVILIKCK